ncbi:MAG: NAD-dependent epimerase/dehydratase family protein [Limnohabitans sp.]|nr:NAD-dependent epimerase/dehydratase family protein [Limnohabitans sp.]
MVTHPLNQKKLNRILVTGASGFLGHALVRQLCNPMSTPTKLILTDTLEGKYQHPQCTCIIGDLSDPQLQSTLFENPIDAVMHLAGIVSGRAEEDWSLGQRVNVQASMDLLHRCRQQWLMHQHKVRWVMSSSIAVYGVPLPSQITEETYSTPSLSYGVQKRMIEMMLNDLSRRGEIDARALRLSGVVIRPPLHNGALSGFNSDLLREPLSGRNYVCPVSKEASIWIMSMQTAIDQLLQLLWMDAEQWLGVMSGHGCWVNAPSWTVTVAQLVQAMTHIDSNIASRIHYQVQNGLQQQFGAWPLQTQFKRGIALGLKDDRNIHHQDVTSFVHYLWQQYQN